MTTALAERPAAYFPAAESQQPMSGTALVLNETAMRRCHALAEVMAAGVATVPKHLQKNVGDCMAVVMQAMQWNMNPFAVAQKTHIVSGTLGYEAQLVNAVVQASGLIASRFHYEYKGNAGDVSCRVGAVIKGETEITWGEFLSEKTVTTKNSPLWKTNPKQQLGYLQVKNWSRLYAPGAILGVYSPDEFEAPRNMGEAVIAEPSPELQAKADSAAAKGMAVYESFWAGAAKESRKLLASGHENRKSTATAVDAGRTLEAAAPAAPTPDVVIFTFAQVADRLIKAKDADALKIAADLIVEVADAGQRSELVAKFEALALAMQGGAA